MRFLRARAAFEESEELVSQLEKRRARHAAVHVRRLEQIGVERHRLVEVVDLQGDMIDPDEPRPHRRAEPTIMGRSTFGALGTSPCCTDSTVKAELSIPVSVSRFGLHPTRL